LAPKLPLAKKTMKPNRRKKRPALPRRSALPIQRDAPSPVRKEGTRLGTVALDQTECVWMRAGVIAYRLCDQGFDCDHCILDAALHGRGSQAAWAPGDWGPPGYRLFPHDRQFSHGHAWAQAVSSESVRVGVDALAAWLVSKVVSVSLPEVGARVKAGETIATLGVPGGEVVISSPVEGRVKARNDLVLGCPELVTAVPYGAGWLVDIEISTAEQRKQRPRLLCGPDAEQLSRGQLHRFHRRMDDLIATRAPQIGRTAADGGEPVTDPQTMLGSAVYLKLVQEFLT